MIDARQLRDLVVFPTLKALGAWSANAEALMMETAAKESELGQYLHQLGPGPALGIWQMEPATYYSIWANYVAYRPEVMKVLLALAATDNDGRAPLPEEMVYNLRFACAMARLRYLPVREAIPADLAGRARYWKTYYNTAGGKGTEAEYVAAALRCLGGR